MSGGFVRDTDGRLSTIASAGGPLTASEQISGGFVRDYSRRELLRILVRSYASALRAAPTMWRKRRAIYRSRRLSRREIYALFIRYRLPARDLAFKD